MVWKYDGSGSWYPDTPARDISDAEAKDLGIVALLKASAHYEHLSDDEHPRLAAKAEKAAEAAPGA